MASQWHHSFTWHRFLLNSPTCNLVLLVTEFLIALSCQALNELGPNFVYSYWKHDFPIKILTFWISKEKPGYFIWAATIFKHSEKASAWKERYLLRHWVYYYQKCHRTSSQNQKELKLKNMKSKSKQLLVLTNNGEEVSLSCRDRQFLEELSEFFLNNRVHQKSVQRSQFIFCSPAGKENN